MRSKCAGLFADTEDVDSLEEEQRSAARVASGLEQAPHCIRDAQCTIGSQAHFYMEPQVMLLIAVHHAVVSATSAAGEGMAHITMWLDERVQSPT